MQLLNNKKKSKSIRKLALLHQKNRIIKRFSMLKDMLLKKLIKSDSKLRK